MMKNKIQELIEQILPVCSGWIQKGNDGLYRFVDPVDGEEISAHYGATHAAASFVIWGKYTNNEDLYAKGLSLLKSILQRWIKYKNHPVFHNDFNNFALCLVEGLVDSETQSLIKDVVLCTTDSTHYTINWLPMRWAVNKKRVEWTSENKYQSVIARCKDIITKATNADGGIEDRLPHGLSFNLQYDLATVAVLQYLNVHGEKQDLSKEIGFLLNAVAPDGDINYQGRGTNQIFAWGLWIYLLASSGQEEALKQALDYLSPRLPKMLEHNNMMLNEWDGKEKFLWWDYHYASVYTAHCMLWLVLAVVDFDKCSISPSYPTTTETGLHIYRSENYFVSWFEGRSEYLAEKGPAIAAIWSKKQGTICKGTFGPWQGAFGNKYIFEDVVLKNYCGLLEVKRNKDWSKNRYVHRLFPKLETETSVSLKPNFGGIAVSEKNDLLEISFSADRLHCAFFNVPLIKQNSYIELLVDGQKHIMYNNSAIRNQYGWCWLSQSRTVSGSSFKIQLK